MGPYDFFLPPVFDALPEAVAEGLLVGCLARNQAARLGLEALRATGPQAAATARLGLELTLLAFDLDPLNPELAKAILTMTAGRNGLLSADARAALGLAANAPWAGPWRQALDAAVRTGDWAGFLTRYDASWPADGAPLASRVLGLAAVASGDPDRLAAWRKGLAFATTPGLHWLAVQADMRLGGREAGMAALRDHLDHWPWNAGALLVLHDLARGLDTARTPLPGELAIFLYTFNKADDLGRTLEGVLASEPGRYRIFVLDNGSTDATPEVLAAFRDRLGPERFFTVRAPVNVGAPAGRNWLKHLPEAQGADFVAYLDDDLSLPPDWALRLGAAVAACPGAGVYGCRITDAGNPAVLQAAELHLAPGAPGQPFAATDLHLQGPDLGQFTACRPCLSVTGCCHLFSRESLDAGGDFDIRFAPSQFDDFDRDLRAALAGRFAVCQGHLAVGHARKSGADTRKSRVAGANAHGNMLKLQGKYDAGEIKRLRREQRIRLLTDIRKKAIWLSRRDSARDSETPKDGGL